MKILLDTHVLLWALQDSPELSEQARYLINEPDNEIYYSLASLWETQIKHVSHPKEMPLNSEKLEKYCVDSGFLFMPIRREHIDYLDKLRVPDGLKHKNPFDRIMICQAVDEGMLFLTRDKRIAQYKEPCIYTV